MAGGIQTLLGIALAMLLIPNRAEAVAGIDVAAVLSLEGFACSQFRAAGFRCRGNVQSYPKPINFYFAEQIAQPSSLLLHIHGHWPGGTQRSTFDPFAKINGDFTEIARQSGGGVIIVVPESPGKNEIHKSAFGVGATRSKDKPSKFAGFLAEISGQLIAAGAPVRVSGPIHISAHSGASTVLDRIGEWAAAGRLANHSRIKSLGILDAIYGGGEGIEAWAADLAERPGSRVFVRYNSADGQRNKARLNERLHKKLQSLMRSQGLTFDFADVRTRHMQFMNTYLGEYLSQVL